ncbi:MAG TPA: 50S ribosomal protein L29 [Bacteroidales bacterium]|jgi:large subunit ribosomal protein L29|nr:50S ribosomal protein L29 [Bacteroidales bacterium]HNW67817.1 50S ribosomal protein L29 [Bacteroidales bacterium]HPT52078.1 50S ribosomal protein L29 [Bacteroidales bacterium]
MKQQVIKELSTPEMKDRLVEQQQHLVKMKLSHAVSPIENPQTIKEQRRTIARLKTEIRKRELNESAN